MDSDAPVKEVLEDLYTLLENMETQNTAILRFLQDQEIASEEKLRPYLEQAGNASSVRWRAARARMAHLFAPAPKKSSDAVSTPKASEAPPSPAAAPAEATAESAKPDQQHPGPPALSPVENRDSDPNEHAGNTQQVQKPGAQADTARERHSP